MRKSIFSSIIIATTCLSFNAFANMGDSNIKAPVMDEKKMSAMKAMCQSLINARAQKNIHDDTVVPLGPQPLAALLDDSNINNVDALDTIADGSDTADVVDAGGSDDVDADGNPVQSDEMSAVVWNCYFLMGLPVPTTVLKPHNIKFASDVTPPDVTPTEPSMPGIIVAVAPALPVSPAPVPVPIVPTVPPVTPATPIAPAAPDVTPVVLTPPDATPVAPTAPDATPVAPTAPDATSKNNDDTAQ